MIGPLLIIGVGGSGGKALRAIKQELNEFLVSSGYAGGIPSAWQFLHIDTVRDGLSFPSPMLPAEEFSCVVPAGTLYRDILETITTRFSPQEQQTLLAGWGIPVQKILINDSPPPIRALIRPFVLASAVNLRDSIQISITKMLSPGAHSDLVSASKNLGDGRTKLEPQVLIFSSLVGASGSGMLMDIIEITKYSMQVHAATELTTFLFAPDVFLSFRQVSPSFIANALAAMNEIIAGQFSDVSKDTSRRLEKAGILESVHSNEDSKGNHAFLLVDRESIKEFCNWPDEVGVGADELILAFAGGMAKEMISGKIGVISTNPAFQSPSVDNLYIDEAGLMPEKFADRFIGSSAAFKFRPFWSFPSLTTPILQEVARSKNDPSTWRQFWYGRRARPMFEAIPFETQIRKSIITGWFIAGIFGLRSHMTIGRNLNTEFPVVQVWNPTLQVPGWSQFPEPLLSAKKVDAQRSWMLPAILASAGLALCEFGANGNQEAINAYKLLLYLGREITTTIPNRDQWNHKGLGDKLPNGLVSKSTFVKNWIETGKKPADNRPLHNLLETSLIAGQDLRQALIATLEMIQSQYSDAWSELTNESWQLLPETWELRNDIDTAIADTLEYVRAS